MSEKRAPIMLVRTGEFLRPAAPLDGELLRELPAAKELRAAITVPTTPRSARQLRLYRGLLKLIVDNLDQNITADDLHMWLKLKMGVSAPVRQRNGDVVWVPRSVAFDKMTHEAFTAYFGEVKALLIEAFIPGMNSEALEREARAMLGEDLPPSPTQGPAGSNVGRRVVA